MMPGVVAGFPKALASGRTKITFEPYDEIAWDFSDPNYGPVGVAEPEWGAIEPGVAGENVPGQIQLVALYIGQGAEETRIRLAGDWVEAEFPWSVIHVGDQSYNFADRTFYQSRFGSTLIYLPGKTSLPPTLTVEVWAE